MAERLAYLEAVVGADITQFRKSMRDIRNETGILSETVSGIGGAARGMTFAFTAPMVALGTYAVDAASKFDGAMRNINSLLLLGEDQFKGLSAEVLAFASTTRDGVIPATEALYEIFSAGITDQAMAMEIWKTSTKVAEAGLSDLSTTTNAITATMSAFNLEQEEATRVGNVWSRMVQIGVGSLDDFLGNAQKILPLSSALGVSLEDMGASVAFLSQGGGGARKAETAFAMMLSNLLKPTEAMKSAFEELGVATGTELLNKFGSVGEAIKALRDETDELTFNAMFSKTGLEAAFRMTQNFDQLKDSVKAFNDGLDTATMDAWEQQAMSFDFQLDLMKSALGGLAVQIGTAIMPLLTPLITGFTGILQSISTLNPELMELGVIFVGVLAAAAPIVWLLTAILNPIGLVAAAAVALGTAFATNFDGMRDKVIGFVDGLLGEGGLAAAQKGIEDFMSTLFGTPATADTEAEDSGKNIGLFAGKGLATAMQTSITESMSAWDLFEDLNLEGVSWNDFQAMLAAEGWTGGALMPGDSFSFFGADLGDKMLGELETALSGALGSKSQAAADLQADLNGFVTPNKVSNIFTRLGDAATAAWPSIQTALNAMWANFKTWVTDEALPVVDTSGSDVIDHIAGWFSPAGTGGNTPVYDALQGLLSGDIGKAASGVGKFFTDNFPQVSKSLSEFVDKFGTWFTDTGVPTIARSIGYFGGKVFLLVHQALKGAFSFLTGGGQGGVGVDEVAAGVQESVLTPLSAGFQDALASGGVDPGTTMSFFANLEALLIAGVVAWKLAPTFATNVIAKIVTSVTGQISATAAFSAIGTAISAKISASMAGGLLGNAWLAGAIKFEGLTAWAATAVAPIGTAISTALAGITLAGAGIALGVVGVTIAAIAMVFDPAVRKQVNDAVGGLIDDAFGEDTYQNMNDGFERSAYNFLGSVFQGMADQTADPAKKAELQAKALELFNWGTLYPEVEVSPVVTMVNPADDGKLDYAELWLMGLDPHTIEKKIGEQEFNINAGGTAERFKANLITEMNALPPPTPEELAAMSSTFEEAVNGSVAAGNYDGQSIVDSLIVPLATGFTTNFGTDSAATMAWAGFVTGVTDGQLSMTNSFILLSQDMLLLNNEATAKMPILQQIVNGTMTAIKGSADAAGQALRSLAATMAGLNGSTITFTTQVVGGQVDGSLAKGISHVPYDGYIAELHKGERVLTAAENRRVSNRNAVGAASASSGDTYNTASFVVQGVTTFDDIIREANRRGYRIEKVR